MSEDQRSLMTPDLMMFDTANVAKPNKAYMYNELNSIEQMHSVDEGTPTGSRDRDIEDHLDHSEARSPSELMNIAEGMEHYQLNVFDCDKNQGNTHKSSNSRGIRRELDFELGSSGDMT